MNNMKRFIILIFSSLLLFSCSKPDPIVVENKDEYYVKYEFTYLKYSTYNTEYLLTFTDSYLNLQTRTYTGTDKEEIICGPFKYGDKIYASWTSSSSYPRATLELSVSKNNSPFALKCSGETIEHIINY